MLQIYAIISHFLISYAVLHNTPLNPPPFPRFPLEVYGNEYENDSEGDEDPVVFDALSDAEALLANCIGELDHMMVSRAT